MDKPRSSDVIRQEIVDRRQQVAALQEREDKLSRLIGDLETKLGRAKHELALAQGQIKSEQGLITALQQALALLMESADPQQMTVAEVMDEVIPERSRRKWDLPSAFEIERRANELDLGTVSQTKYGHAEAVLRIVKEAEDPIGQQELADLLAAQTGNQYIPRRLSESLAILMADGRVECANFGSETWRLTPPERGSASLGSSMENFKGRTTSWPAGTAREPGTAPHVVIEEGSYESGKR